MYISRKSPLLVGLVSATAIERPARMGLDNPTIIEHGYARGMVGADNTGDMGLMQTEGGLLQNLEDDVVSFQTIVNSGGEVLDSGGAPTETQVLYRNGLTQAQVLAQLMPLNQNVTLLNANWKAALAAGTATDAQMYTNDSQRLQYGAQLQQLGGTFNNPESISTYAGSLTADWNGLVSEIQQVAHSVNPFASGAQLTTMQWILVGAGAGILGVVALKVLI